MRGGTGPDEGEGGRCTYTAFSDIQGEFNNLRICFHLCVDNLVGDVPRELTLLCLPYSEVISKWQTATDLLFVV